MTDYEELEVTVEFNDTEEEIIIEVNMNELWEYEMNSDKIDYIKSLVRKKVNNDKVKVHFNKKDLVGFFSFIDDKDDTSLFHPNESYEDFMDHEDY